MEEKIVTISPEELEKKRYKIITTVGEFVGDAVLGTPTGIQVLVVSPDGKDGMITDFMHTGGAITDTQSHMSPQDIADFIEAAEFQRAFGIQVLEEKRKAQDMQRQAVLEQRRMHEKALAALEKDGSIPD